jgi:hypothetical protein
MKGNIMKRITSMIGAAALGLTLLTLGGTQAHADPYSCAAYKPNNWSFSAKCTGGTGEYRSYTKCNASLAFDYTEYGPWVRIGQVSTAVCIRASIKDKAESPQGVQVR